jgi:hypothetical protein
MLPFSDLLKCAAAEECGGVLGCSLRDFFLCFSSMYFRTVSAFALYEWDTQVLKRACDVSAKLIWQRLVLETLRHQSQDFTVGFYFNVVCARLLATGTGKVSADNATRANVSCASFRCSFGAREDISASPIRPESGIVNPSPRPFSLFYASLTQLDVQYLDDCVQHRLQGRCTRPKQLND